MKLKYGERYRTRDRLNVCFEIAGHECNINDDRPRNRLLFDEIQNAPWRVMMLTRSN
jgi:hypothetical protein